MAGLIQILGDVTFGVASSSGAAASGNVVMDPTGTGETYVTPGAPVTYTTNWWAIAAIILAALLACAIALIIVESIRIRKLKASATEADKPSRPKGPGYF